MNQNEIHVAPSATAGCERVLNPDALAFLRELQRTFGGRRDALLAQRAARHAEIAAAGTAGASFPDSTRAIRDDSTWTVAPIPAALLDRRVEITGPTERKMAINALNSGAKVWLADLEDANTPHWENVVSGQVNLIDAVREQISYDSPQGVRYELHGAGADLPTIVVRPRGWHLDERHVLIDGAPTVGALVDFGLFFFHNATELVVRGRGPYFYLPKLESHREARLWTDAFAFSERYLGIPAGTIRATVLIETLPAAFEMEEMLYELRDYAAGLNAGRWDYLFSLIKVFRAAGEQYVLPDRNAVTMTSPFMRAYTELLVTTCHRRGAMAIGGMSAFIPSRRDEAVNRVALDKVRADKQREANDGFDGSWVAHPDLVPICADEFAAVLGQSANQLERRREHAPVSAADLVTIPRTAGDVTEPSLRNNVSVALRYLATWLAGNGAVAIYNLMEDAATAEIARAQVWQWVHNAVQLDTGTIVTTALVHRVLGEELAAIADDETFTPGPEHLKQAEQLFTQTALDDEFVPFLTLPAYELID